MPKFQITGPDGGTYEVEAPEGASDQQVLDYVKTQVAPQAPRERVSDEQALATSARMKGERQQAEATAQKQAADKYAGQDVATMNPVMRGLGGAKAALDRWNLGLKSALPKSVQDAGDALDRKLGLGGLTPETVSGGKAFVEEGGDAAKRGEFVGDAAPGVAVGGGVSSMLRSGTTMLPRAVGALVRGIGEVASGAGMGAASAAPGERSKGAAAGGVASGGGAILTRALGGAVRPLMTDEARELQRRGIQPTVGQSVGGFVNNVEQKLTSVPFHGESIGGARNRAGDEWVNATIREAAPGVRGVGDDALRDAERVLDRQYRNAMSLMPQHFTMDPAPIEHAALTAVDNPALGLTREAQGHVLDWVQQNVLNRSRNLTPQIAKDVESDMGKLANTWVNSTTASERNMGQALRDIHQQWRASLTAVGDSTGTGAGAALRDADAAWRAYRAVDRAGASAGAQSAEVPGRYTPRALRRAIEAEDKSQRNTTTRYGRIAPNSPMGRLNELSRLGEQVLPNRVPDSGTAGRNAHMAGLLDLPVLAAELATWPITAVLYSRAGQQALTRGARPALEALSRQGAAGARAAQLIEQYGPDAVLATMRTGAAPRGPTQPQQGAPNAAQ